MRLIRAGHLPGVLLMAACCHGHAAPGAGTSTYVLVTQLRPEAPGKLFPHERAGYALCAEVASHRHVTVKPFPAIPPDFVSKRTTYASDGKRILVREVQYAIDARKNRVEDGCEVRLASWWSVTVISAGEQRVVEQDIDGKMHGAPAETVIAEPVRASLLGRYTLPKTVKGVALKCSASDTCIVDPKVALVAQGVRPVPAVARIDDVRTWGTALLLEPVSLTVGRAVDPALFSVEPAK